MITLHLAQLLEDQGFGVLDTDIFWESIPLDSSGNSKDGIWVVTRGSEVTRLNVGIQSFDIYGRFSNKLTTAQKLEDILSFLKEAYGEVCDLPTVSPYSTKQYTNVMITPTSGVESVGSDEQDKIVKVISGEIRYKEL